MSLGHILTWRCVIHLVLAVPKSYSLTELSFYVILHYRPHQQHVSCLKPCPSLLCVPPAAVWVQCIIVYLISSSLVCVQSCKQQPPLSLPFPSYSCIVLYVSTLIVTVHYRSCSHVCVMCARDCMQSKG